jgi:hypothetical protein
MREIPLTQGYVALVDDEDYEDVMAAGPWHVTSRRGTRYATKRIKGPYLDGRRGAGISLLMHRLILGPNPDQDIDHANGDGLDNRRENLRVASTSQNMANQRKTRGVSRFKGVTFLPQRWRAAIQYQGRKKNLGNFATEEEAARAYDRAAREIFGEFARLNYPKG